ncbi:MAG TPA: hypothetical protein VGW34_09485 [Allosphingosinicella sp.]|nr:hypothetical protein [Allosphingosinicella sp.]
MIRRGRTVGQSTASAESPDAPWSPLAGQRPRLSSNYWIEHDRRLARENRRHRLCELAGLVVAAAAGAAAWWLL